MDSDRERLVRRIQLRLGSAESGADGVGLSCPDTVELKARLTRLRALGDRFAGVRLSSHVDAGAETGALCCVGGDCVATEV